MKVVLITVAPEKAEHYVHSHKLCEASGFFRAALNSGLKESSEQVIDLPEEKAETVDNFIDWLYCERLPEISAEALEDLVQKKDYPCGEVDRLCDLHIFADKYDIPRLKKCVVQDLVKLATKCRAPNSGTIGKYYKATVKASPLRRLLCDWYTLQVGQKFFQDDRHQEVFSQRPEWAVDLLTACARNWVAPLKHEIDTIMKADDYF